MRNIFLSVLLTLFALNTFASGVGEFGNIPAQDLYSCGNGFCKVITSGDLKAQIDEFIGESARRISIIDKGALVLKEAAGKIRSIGRSADSKSQFAKFYLDFAGRLENQDKLLAEAKTQVSPQAPIVSAMSSMVPLLQEWEQKFAGQTDPTAIAELVRYRDSAVVPLLVKLKEKGESYYGLARIFFQNAGESLLFSGNAYNERNSIFDIEMPVKVSNKCRAFETAAVNEIGFSGEIQRKYGDQFRTDLLTLIDDQETFKLILDGKGSSGPLKFSCPRAVFRSARFSYDLKTNTVRNEYNLYGNSIGGYVYSYAAQASDIRAALRKAAGK